MGIERRQEPYWVWACPICKRQLRDTISTCCDGSFGMTVYCVPDDLHRGAVEALWRIADYSLPEGHDDLQEYAVSVLQKMGVDLATYRPGGQS